jgi:hypothetical protein
MQWTCSPIPSGAAPGAKPAPWQASLICTQGASPWAAAVVAVVADIPQASRTSALMGAVA